MTAFEDKFAKAGWTKADNTFETAIALYLNHGGTIARAHWILDRHKETAGKGHVTDAPHATVADPRPPNAGHIGDEDQGRPAGTRGKIPDSGQSAIEIPAPRAADQGRGSLSMAEAHAKGAPKLSRTSHAPIGTHAGFARPAGPTPAQRAAARTGGHHSVPTIFDKKLMPDLPAIGDIYSDQLPRLVASGVRNSSFLLKLMNHGIPPEPMKIRDYIPAEIVKKLWEASEKIDVKSVIGEGILLEPDGQLSFIKRSA